MSASWNTRIKSDLTLRAGGLSLPAVFASPPGAAALVLVGREGEQTRSGTFDQLMAEALSEGGLATILFDLLTPGEEAGSRDGDPGAEIRLLSERLVSAVDWVGTNDTTRELRLGLFGANLGAAAALVAAARRPAQVGAVVACGGRPDLAGEALREVKAPTLFLVGGRDKAVIVLNEWARKLMRVKPKLEIVPSASHFFREPGTLEEASRLACRWFQEKLTSSPG